MNNDPLRNLKAPATGLIVAGCLNGVTAFLTLLGGIFRLTGGLGNESLPTDRPERIGFFIGTIGTYSIALISLLLAPVIVYGAVQLMQGRKPGLARIASILAIVPLTSCCFVVGAPFGIWAMIVLSKPEIKELFRHQG